ncbi:hypothetical protein D3C85_1518880 [compost metagenome]
MIVDAELRLGVGLEGAGAHRLAGLGAADMQRLAARCCGAEVMVEADHAMHFGTGQL